MSSKSLFMETTRIEPSQTVGEIKMDKWVICENFKECIEKKEDCDEHIHPHLDRGLSCIGACSAASHGRVKCKEIILKEDK